jgi:hypothetical protein
MEAVEGEVYSKDGSTFVAKFLIQGVEHTFTGQSSPGVFTLENAILNYGWDTSSLDGTQEYNACFIRPEVHIETCGITVIPGVTIKIGNAHISGQLPQDNKLENPVTSIDGSGVWTRNDSKE